MAPHPGPRPEEFRFPFDEAEDALAAIEDAGAEVRAMVSAHEDAVVGARVDFEGETRAGFDQGFEQLMGEAEDGRRRLEAQYDELADDVATARLRREASLDERAEWERALDRYQQANPLAPVSI